MKRWLNEPLVHFLVLGALLFGVYAWLHRGESGGWDKWRRPGAHHRHRRSLT